MDQGTLQGLGTVFAFIAMIAIFAWAFSKNRKKDFDEAANLPFADEPNDLKEGKDNE
ncbi:MAG: cbb3-type cytochrome c oxidase subunit 3 [Gammaproteobacteria bacterium]|jgi:cytochrome c oxidase cbb3-type subunit 4|nr:cbb3-type cytochrome c oxidase subunit 3 [Gammaproteobacteria bacterium]